MAKFPDPTKDYAGTPVAGAIDANQLPGTEAPTQTQPAAIPPTPVYASPVNNPTPKEPEPTEIKASPPVEKPISTTGRGVQSSSLRHLIPLVIGGAIILLL